MYLERFSSRGAAILFFLSLRVASSHDLPGLDPYSDRSILHGLYDSTDGENWFRRENWRDPDTSPCTWEGVRCEEEDRVTSLSLSHNNLKGLVPMTRILQMERLRTLKLDNNGIRFPYEVDLEDVSDDNLGSGIVSNLEVLDLSQTSLETLDTLFGAGNIVVRFGKMKKLYLSNTNLKGEFDVNAWHGTSMLQNLERLVLESNALSGSLPKGLVSYLTKLTYLSLNDNKMSGSLPFELGEMTSIKYLYLQQNHFSASIPAWRFYP